MNFLNFLLLALLIVKIGWIIAMGVLLLFKYDIIFEALILSPEKPSEKGFLGAINKIFFILTLRICFF